MISILVWVAGVSLACLSLIALLAIMNEIEAR
jgi:hypothetical protein